MGRLGLHLSLRRSFCSVVAVFLALQLLLIVLRVPQQSREEQSRGLVQVAYRYSFWSTEVGSRQLNLSTGASSNVSRDDSRQVVLLTGRRQSEKQLKDSYVSVTTHPPSTFESSLVAVPQHEQTRIPPTTLITQAQRKVEMKAYVPQRPMRLRHTWQPLSGGVHSVLAPLPPPEIDSTPFAIRQDLQKCSLNMGMDAETLDNASDALTNVTEKASIFLRAIRSIVPSTFNADYSSPCWNADVVITKTFELATLQFLSPGAKKELPIHYVNMLARHMLQVVGHRPKPFFCLPYFFIAGFPKSGTTSLDHALRRHPQIAGAFRKEIHWWTRIPHVGEPGYNSDYARLVVMNYLLNFRKASEKIEQHIKSITYDGSQSTLWDSNFFVHQQDYCAMPAVLSRVLPKAKFIVLMRNPVTRVYSHYLWSCAFSFGNDSSKWPDEMQQGVSDYFHTQVVTAIEYFKQCLKRMSVFECTNVMRFKDFYGFSRDNAHCGDVGFRLSIGLYYVHLSKWLHFYSKDHFLFLKMEDMSEDPYSLMVKITEFLELGPVSKEWVMESFAKKVNAQHIITGEDSIMQSRTRELLEDFYKPYNSLLAALVADNRFLWQN